MIHPYICLSIRTYKHTEQTAQTGDGPTSFSRSVELAEAPAAEARHQPPGAETVRRSGEAEKKASTVSTGQVVVLDMFNPKPWE